MQKKRTNKEQLQYTFNDLKNVESDLFDLRKMVNEGVINIEKINTLIGVINIMRSDILEQLNINKKEGAK